MRKHFSSLRAAFITAALGALPLAAHAQPRPFGNTTLPKIIGSVINNAVGLLGTVSLAIFVYGGFIWMTAQGDESKVKQAKSTIFYATFGIIIAFLSFAIVKFVLTTIETSVK